ncbi:astacin [Ostertagia ostertagi]
MPEHLLKAADGGISTSTWACAPNRPGLTIKLFSGDAVFIRLRLKYFHDRTCINFVENATAPNRIKVQQGESCSSHIGMKGGEQIMSLPSLGNSIGAVDHEFMHALGFVHTYVRHDRDTYIKVNLANVEEEMKSTFTKENRTLNYTPYEYGSLMHHSSIHGTISTVPTMSPMQSRFMRTMGATIISFYDIAMINHHYKCNGKYLLNEQS